MIKSNWDVFKYNFPDNPQKNFEWMCYQLFCKEFNKDNGIFRFYNQPALEAEPIEVGDEIIGFQAKFYTVPLNERKSELKETIEKASKRYEKLTKILFYINSDWTCSNNSKQEIDDRRAATEKEIEDHALKLGIKIEWRSDAFFESPFVAVNNADICQYFFSKSTNDYYERIRKIRRQSIEIPEQEKYTTLLKLENGNKITKQFSLYEYISDLLKENDLENFPNIFVRGNAGVGKSTEMKFAYNKLLDELSTPDSYRTYNFLPTPYLFELKNYYEGCLGEFQHETPLLFIDGLDELPITKIMILIKELHNIQAKNSSCRYILAGRGASFIIETSEFDHVDVELLPHIDIETLELTSEFKGTPLGSLITIPFYRDFATTDKAHSLKTYKDFISAIVLDKLKKDIQRLDRSENKSSSSKSASKVNLNKIQDNISKLVYNLFKSDRRVFSREDLGKDWGDEEEFFFIKSSLLDYNKSDETFSFCSNIYFEYFLAKYYLKQDFALLQKDFFLPVGNIFVQYKPHPQYINILVILLNSLDEKSGLYKQLSNKLKCENSAYILLTDYTLLPVQDRFDFYNKIINEYNAGKKVIYYRRFTKTYDILANIDSLADSMHNLLPEDFYNEAVKEHCDVVKDFLNSHSVEKIIAFENAMILLSVHNSNWQYEQQEMLKDIAIPLIKFFLNHELAKKVKGLLSEDVVLRWYENYIWTENWKEKEWISFVKELTSVENTNFYNFKDEKEYCCKLKLFIHFHNNTFIQKMLVPLAIKILSSTSPTAIDSWVPNIIDDNFATPTMDFNYDICRFTEIFKNTDVSISEILEILQIYPIRYYSIPLEAHDLYREVLEAFERKIPDIKEENISEFYNVLVRYINLGIHLEDFSNKYLKQLNDDQKEKIFNLLLADLIKKADWQSLWMLPRSVIIPLLDMGDKETSKRLFEKLRDMKSIYQNCINNLDREENKGHPLHDMATVEYLELFADRVEVEKKLKERLDAFNAEKIPVQEKEFDVITNKDNAFVNEVEHIFEYIDKHPDFSESKDILGKLYDLQLDRIEQNLKFDHNGEYVKPDIFSPFAIDFLIHNNEDDLKSNHEIIEIINDWFADEKYFWRYFFWIYICYRKAEEVDKFLNKYPELEERIKETMQQEVSQSLLENDVLMYDGGKNRFWVVPFVHYLTRFYSNKLPDWFDKDKILNFVAYPAWQLSTGYGIHVNAEFKWKSWSSVVEWIKEIAGFSDNDVVEKALSLLPKIKSEQSKAQIISVFINKVLSESMYKQQMFEVIIDNTIVEIQKDYNNNNDLVNWVLSCFWLKATENFVERIYSAIDFEKYDLKDKNSCRNAVLEYFCNVATNEKKAEVIERLKNKIDMPNIQIYLAKLGYEKAIIKIIDAFLKGQDLNRSWDAQSKMFGNSKKSFKLLRKYCKLYDYSLEKENYRRDYLYTYAKRGIMQTATKWNFLYIKYCLNKEIKKLKKNSLYYEHIQDFLNEIEQRIYSHPNDHHKCLEEI
ncbi:hypothetical protein II898_03585 [bacterium]|nr:hypothetical protein [bacterium]